MIHVTVGIDEQQWERLLMHLFRAEHRRFYNDAPYSLDEPVLDAMETRLRVMLNEGAGHLVGDYQRQLDGRIDEPHLAAAIAYMMTGDEALQDRRDAELIAERVRQVQAS